uniref:F-box/kelch-repeat protein n=1 Tax=Timema genevievae TaxID=629358 RepID=A0A7R9JVW7_TIMGE|nr:unnamed protein product [Timema genevievae]
MYVFGGCTSTSTTFNDLWSLNLNERCWLRPLTMGNYPTPKACATLVSYQDKLFLFGGWSHPSPYPIFQAWKLFNELHVYNIESKRWSSMVHSTEPPAMAGHSATIQGHLMVVFGGLHKTGDHGLRTNSNDVWCYDIENLVWTKQATTDNRPAARFGQSQVSLDKTSLIILVHTIEGRVVGLVVHTIEGRVVGLIIYTIEGRVVGLTVHTIDGRVVELIVHTIDGRVVGLVVHTIEGRVVELIVHTIEGRVVELIVHTIEGRVVELIVHTIEGRVVELIVHTIDGRVVGLVVHTIEGGCGGPNMVFKDVWRLSLDGAVWSWQELTVNNPQWGAPQMWCHPACKVGQYAVVLGTSILAGGPHLCQGHWNNPMEALRQHETERFPRSSVRDNNDPNVNGRRGVLSSRAGSSSGEDSDCEDIVRRHPLPINQQIPAMAAFNQVSGAAEARSRNRQRQLGVLHQFEERIRRLSTPPAIPPRAPTMSMFVLDLSMARTGHVTWLQSRKLPWGEPKETILYSLVTGRGELIMFGGFQYMASTVSNTVHFISTPCRGL